MRAAFLLSIVAVGVGLASCGDRSKEIGTTKPNLTPPSESKQPLEAPTESRRIPLDSLPAVKLNVGSVPVTAWVADTDEVRTEGLMFVTQEQMPENHGMLFVFPDLDYLGFWMKNTVIPLDIAFLRSDGTIVTIHTMSPLDESTYRSSEPAQYALEMHAGWFERNGVKVGDRIDLSPLATRAKE